MTRRVMVFKHAKRRGAIEAYGAATRKLTDLGMDVVDETFPGEVELVLVLGGDGTFLYGAESARRLDVPLIGINTGHVGFLAEMEIEDIAEVARRIAERDYRVETRMTIDINMQLPDGSVINDWALNEAAVLHTDGAHPAHFGVGVDGTGVSTYGADGILLATATGSTAYTFSVGGPVMWPDIEGMLMVPLAAHGLFTRPLVVGPASAIDLSVLRNQNHDVEVWCDGLRANRIPPGTSLRAVKGRRSVKVARMSEVPFSGRLVAKFHLPVNGWRLRDE